MNDVTEMDKALLLRLAAENESNSAFFEWAAEREKNRAETSVETVMLRGRMDRGSAITLLRELAEGGFGRFVLGRKGDKTRIVWSFSLRSIGAVACGRSDEIEEVEEIEEFEEIEDEEDGDSTDEIDELVPLSFLDPFISHRFWLRRDLRITVKLPADLTAEEARRLAAFVRSLPFGDEG